MAVIATADNSKEPVEARREGATKVMLRSRSATTATVPIILPNIVMKLSRKGMITAPTRDGSKRISTCNPTIGRTLSYSNRKVAEMSSRRAREPLGS